MVFGFWSFVSHFRLTRHAEKAKWCHRKGAEQQSDVHGSVLTVRPVPGKGEVVMRTTVRLLSAAAIAAAFAGPIAAPAFASPTKHHHAAKVSVSADREQNLNVLNNVINLLGQQKAVG
jgi:hypothetical protein